MHKKQEVIEAEKVANLWCWQLEIWINISLISKVILVFNYVWSPWILTTINAKCDETCDLNA